MSLPDRPGAFAGGLTVALATLFLVLGCDGGTEPTVERVLGVIIDRTGDTAGISVPDRGILGEPVVLRVTTYGGGCRSKDETVVNREGMTATVTPYDRVVRGVTCTDDLRPLDHTAAIRFPGEGTARITIRGQEETRRGGTVQVEVVQEVEIRRPER